MRNTLTPRDAEILAAEAASSVRWIGNAQGEVHALQTGQTGDLAKVADYLHRANGHAQKVRGSLRTHGMIAPSADAPPIDLLKLDTPDVRQLLSVLESAQEIAERVDAARGRSVRDDVPLQPGESAGTDLAESIALLVLRLRNEVGGAYSPHE